MLEKLNLLNAYSFNNVAVRSFVEQILNLSDEQKIDCWVDPAKLIGQLCSDEYVFYRHKDNLYVRYESCRQPCIVARWEECQSVWAFEDDFPWNTLTVCSDMVDYVHCGRKHAHDPTAPKTLFGRCSS